MLGEITLKLREARDASPKDLRKFGVVFACILAGVFYLFIPWLRSVPRPAAAIQLASLLSFFAFVFPIALKPVYLIAMLIGSVLGAINNRIILSVIFFVVFTPLALLMRSMSKSDSMRSKFEPQLKSYRILRENKDLVKNKERAF
jgi:hypothetical protein